MSILADFNDAVVYMVSVLISYFFGVFSSHSGIVPSVLTIIGIIFTFRFHNVFSFLA